MDKMTVEKAKEILDQPTIAGSDYQSYDKTEARGFLKGYAQGVAEERERAICDCHTWPTKAEMHDYCVAIEKKLEAYQSTGGDK